MTDTNQFDALEWLKSHAEDDPKTFPQRRFYRAAADELEQARARIADLEAERDRLRSENEALQERLKTAREAADEIDNAVSCISYVAGIGKLLDATELVSPETADRHTQEGRRARRG